MFFCLNICFHISRKYHAFSRHPFDAQNLLMGSFFQKGPWINSSIIRVTLPKFNMEPKNDGFQKGIS